MVRRILILGGDADGNLGDRAILMGMCRELRGGPIEVELTVVSSEPDRAAADYRARVIPPLPRGLLALCGTARRSDLILVGGGGLFQDDDSLVKMPYWALRIALVRLLQRRVVGYSLGVGPLDAASSRLFARLAFACLSRVSVRDREAQRIAQPLTTKPVELVPDPAILLPAGDPDDARRRLREAGVPLDDRPLIGVTTRRWFPARRRLVPAVVRARLRPASHEGSQELTALIAAALDRVVESHEAFVVLLPTYRRPHEGDDTVCRMIMDAMASNRARMVVVEDAAMYKAVTAQMRVLVGGRMHPTILAAGAGIPVVGLAYNPKFVGFFDLIGQRHRLLDMKDFVNRKEIDALARLIREALEGGANLQPPIDDAQRRIRRFNDELLELIA
ncbi:MAG: polysaccharide pyruvyl transferase family protein [Gemmatimonadota bacterium]